MVTFLVGRVGCQGGPVEWEPELAWLAHLTLTAWFVINPVILLGITLDCPLNWKLVR